MKADEIKKEEGEEPPDESPRPPAMQILRKAAIKFVVIKVCLESNGVIDRFLKRLGQQLSFCSARFAADQICCNLVYKIRIHLHATCTLVSARLNRAQPPVHADERFRGAATNPSL